jgi:hypothetical protein
MSKILKSLQVVTQSFIGTPDTGTGVLFASGSKIYFENATGSIFPLGGPGYIRILEYTGSNPGGGTLTYTWTKPTNIKYIQVICVGAGGGGGSGAISLSSNRYSAGGGGGGGAIAWGFFDKNDLTASSYTISIGVGGAGGVPAVYTGGAGANSGQFGSAGGYTTFGDIMVSASGGSGGGRGASITNAAGGAGGLATACLPGPGFAIPGGTGGTSGFNNANSTAPTNFYSTPLTPTSTAGGGAGSHVYNLSGQIYFSGSLGAGGFEWNTLRSNNTTFYNSGSNDLVTGTVLLHFTSSVPFATTYGLGGGGNGGDNASTQAPGGNGGNYGAGGGGSNARLGATNGQQNQPGGSGSSGLCIVVEYY